MKCNVGTIDRVTRALVGIILGSGGLMLEARLLRWPMLVAGAVLIFTAVVAWCPLYYASGWTTQSKTT
jgi:predicted anti-sigma-YlaC factor YlaD